MLDAELHSFLGALVLVSELGRIRNKCLWFSLFVCLFVLFSCCLLFSL